MLMPVKDGGYSRARHPEGNIRYSKSTLIKYQPNWFVPMTAQYKSICGCECCTMSQEMQEDLHNIRLEALKDLKELLSVMPSGQAKLNFERKIKVDESEILLDGKPIHTIMWRVCNAVVYTPISIADTDLKVPYIKHALGHCKECGTFNAPKMELASDYPVVYSGFASHKQCSVNGIGHLENST